MPTRASTSVHFATFSSVWAFARRFAAATTFLRARMSRRSSIFSRRGGLRSRIRLGKFGLPWSNTGWERSMSIRYELIIYWSEQDNSFIVEVPELRGCMADGDTYEQALANARLVI